MFIGKGLVSTGAQHFGDAVVYQELGPEHLASALLADSSGARSPTLLQWNVNPDQVPVLPIIDHVVLSEKLDPVFNTTIVKTI